MNPLQERQIKILEERIANQLARVAEAKLAHDRDQMNFSPESTQRWAGKSARKLAEAEEQLFALESRLERVLNG